MTFPTQKAVCACLADKPMGQIAGSPNESHQTPLSHCLREILDIRGAGIYPISGFWVRYSRVGERVRSKLPLWASNWEFAMSSHLLAHGTTRMTAGKALEILDAIGGRG